MKRVFLIFVLCWVATASISSQTAARRRYSRDGLTLEVPPDWAALPDNPWAIRAQSVPGTAVFGRVQPVRSSWYADFDEWTTDWLARSRAAYGPLKFTRRKVSGFDALTYWHSNTESRNRRDTWIAVPDLAAKRGGSVYSFSLIGASDPGILAVYERMLSSMRLDARVLTLNAK
jgi:hypothetical protein